MIAVLEGGAGTRDPFEAVSDTDLTGVEIITVEKRQRADDPIEHAGHAEVAGSLDDAVMAARGRHVAILSCGYSINRLGFRVLRWALAGREVTRLLYTDEFLRVDGALQPVMKPAFDPVLFDDIDYLSAFAIYDRAELSRLVSGGEAGGACPGDLLCGVLRQVDEADVLHLPHPVVTREQVSARSRGHIAKRNLDRRDWPTVTVVIPNKNAYHLINCVLEGLLKNTDYPNLRVIVVDNGSDDANVLALYETYKRSHPAFTAEVKAESFNFSRSVNRGLRSVGEGHVLLLNNDVEMREPGWLKEMVGCLDYERVGIVGAKLLYPDDSIQHAGVIVGMNSLASHWYYKCPKDAPGHFNRLQARNSMTCVTGAVMLISESCRETVGLWNEADFAVAYNDVDYCLRAYSAGLRCVWTPFSTLCHHESISRRQDRSRERLLQFQAEKQALKDLHGTHFFEDPAFNPWLSKRPGRFRFRRRHALPLPRNWWSQTPYRHP